MGFDILGFFVLFFVLIVIGLIQGALALGVMYGMHRLVPEKLTETNYGTFNFDNFNKAAFQELLVRLAIVFVGSTFLLHMLDYFLVGRLIVAHRLIVSLLLLILESGAIGGGLFYFFQLDKFRLLVLTGFSAFFYLFFLWYLVVGKILF